MKVQWCLLSTFSDHLLKATKGKDTGQIKEVWNYLIENAPNIPERILVHVALVRVWCKEEISTELQ